MSFIELERAFISFRMIHPVIGFQAHMGIDGCVTVVKLQNEKSESCESIMTVITKFM